MSGSEPLRTRKTSVIVAGIVALISGFLVQPFLLAFMISLIAFFYALSPIKKPKVYRTKLGYVWIGLTLSTIGMLTPIIKLILGVTSGEI